jgi:AAA+ ATPase superfamily predicted ATPase
MHFVGREKEINQIRETLEGGKNIIISGKYGMGRTSLIRHIANKMKDQSRFIFVDFSETPRMICRHLLTELIGRQKFKDKYESMNYKSSRFRIVHLDLGVGRKQVLVLDNIAKLSFQKADLIRYLAWEKRFQFVAIVESFISKDEFLRLRVRLYPAEIIMFQHLDKRKVYEFYQHLSEQHGLHWTEGHIKNLAEITGGYPLRMKEIALRQLAERQQDGGDK